MNVKEAPRNLAKALLLPINPAAIIILGIYTTLWGAWLAAPWWHVFSTAPMFSMLKVAAPNIIPPEYFWGSIAIICGSIIIYGALKRSYRALITGASVAGWHWLMIAVFYFWGDWHNTGGITSLVFCVYACFVYLNIRVNYKERHKRYGILSA